MPDHNFVAAPLPLTRLIRHACLALALGGLPQLALHAAETTAAEAAQPFDLAPAALGDALTSFAAQAGITIAFTPNQVGGKRSRQLKGHYNSLSGLQQLLTGSGMEAVYQGNRTYVLRKLAVPDSADSVLPAISVNAGSERTSEGNGAYTTSARSNAATPLGLEWRETPQSVAILTRQRLDDLKVDSIIDALEATPGITAFRQGLGTDLDGLWARGFTISNYLLDGMPSSLQGGSRLNTAMFDRIEIVRGANGLMSGIGNPSASVNLVRKRPTAERQLSLNAEVGRWDKYGLGVDLSAPLNNDASVRGRVVADYRQQDFWIDRYEKKTKLLYGIVEADLGAQTLLSLGASHQTEDNTAPLRTGLPLTYSNGVAINLPRNTNIAPNWSYYNAESNSAFASLKQEFGNGWTGKIDLVHQQFKYDGVLYYLSGSIDQASGVGSVLWPVRWQTADRQTSMDAQLNGKFSWFGRQHELAAGIALSDMTMHGADYGGWVGPWTGYDGSTGNLFTWNGNAKLPTFTKAADSETREHQNSGYASARFSLSDATKLIVGSRVTDWKRVTDTTTTAGATSSTRVHERNVVVPYAGLMHELNQTYSLYGSYTRMFQPQDAGVRDLNNNVLDPQVGNSVEAGVKAGFLDERLLASMALFRTRQDNLASYDAATDRYVALDGITTKGVELELNGEPAHGWNLSAGYAFISSKDKDGNKAQVPIPRHGAKLFTTWQAAPKLTIGGGINWQSEYGYLAGPTQGSYVLVNALARYALSQHTSVSLNLNNLFDKVYFSGISSYGGVYGPPRNLTASLRHTF